MPLMPHWPLYLGPNRDITDSVGRVKEILGNFDNPQNKLRNIIHVTGTNGKGSTVNYIDSILRDAKYSVANYTSPHIHLCNERIKINGEMIDDNVFFELNEEVRFVCEKMNFNPTIFEVTTIMAILLFFRKNCDFNIFEVGMGGFSDATNVFDDNPPIISVITPIHLDHTKFLGNTPFEIALNKSFIIKNNSICISGPQSEDVLKVLQARCVDLNSDFFHFGKDFNCSKIDGDNENFLMQIDAKIKGESIKEEFLLPIPPLKGDHQMINASLAGFLSVLFFFH